MPKRVLKIDDFNGGINSAEDPRDIADNEFVDISGFSTSTRGKLKRLYASEDHIGNSSQGRSAGAFHGTFGQPYTFSSDYGFAQAGGNILPNNGCGVAFDPAGVLGTWVATNHANSVWSHLTTSDNPETGFQWTNTSTSDETADISMAANQRFHDGMNGAKYRFYALVSYADAEVRLKLRGGDGYFFKHDTTELIAAAEDREMSTTSLGWTIYDPSSDGFTYTETGDVIQINGTSSTNKQGAGLANTYFATLVKGQSYRVSAKIYSTSGAMTGFRIQLGGVTTDAFSITNDGGSASATKVYNIKVNADSALNIYCENNTAQNWFIDDVSIMSNDIDLDMYRTTSPTSPAGGDTWIGGTFTANDSASDNPFVLKAWAVSGNNKKLVISNIQLVLDEPTGDAKWGVPDNYIVSSSSLLTMLEDTGRGAIYSTNDHEYGLPLSPNGYKRVTLGSLKQGFDTCFFVDGALRYTNKDYSNRVTNGGRMERTGWYGFIDRQHFGHADPADNTLERFNGWFQTWAELLAPHVGNTPAQSTNFYEHAIGTGGGYDEFNGKSMTSGGDNDNPDSGISLSSGQASGNPPLHVYVEWGAVEGEGWDNKTWNFGITYIYDGEPGNMFSGQESPLLKCTGDSSIRSTTTAGHGPRFTVSIYRHAQRGINPRISGIRIYMKEQGTETYYAQGFVCMTKGALKFGSEASFGYWATSTAHQGSSQASFNTYRQFPDSQFSYEHFSGLSRDTTSTNVHYKTSVVLNNTLYAGHVRYAEGDIHDDANHRQVLRADAVIKSPVGKYDALARENIVDWIPPDDGDEIVKLMAFADRILMFKKRTLYIINAAQEVEFPEEKLDGKGIEIETAAIHTEYGIVWANENGVFLYTGKQTVNLLDKENRRIISSEMWERFYRKTISIGYISKTKELMFTCSQFGDSYDVGFEDYNNITDATTEGSRTTLTLTEKAMNTLNPKPGDTLRSGDSTLSNGRTGIHSITSPTTLIMEGAARATDSGSANISIMRHRDVLVFNLFNQAWTNAPEWFNIASGGWGYNMNSDQNADKHSRFINDYRNDLYYITATGISNATTVKKINTSKLSAGRVRLVTKDYNFNAPGVRKKVYKVIIHFKGDGDKIYARYTTNGTSGTSQCRVGSKLGTETIEHSTAVQMTLGTGGGEGSGYAAGDLIRSVSTAGSGHGFEAFVYAVDGSGSPSAIYVTNPGEGYISTPSFANGELEFSTSGGSGAVPTIDDTKTYPQISTTYKSFDSDKLTNATDTSTWTKLELKPATASEANNIESFQLYLCGYAEANFEINNIEIIYRVKGIK